MSELTTARNMQLKDSDQVQAMETDQHLSARNVMKVFTIKSLALVAHCTTVLDVQK